LQEDWGNMTKELSTRASRFEAIRTDSWDGFWEDLRRFLSNLVDFPLISRPREIRGGICYQ
jgi:hypothetical protein